MISSFLQCLGRVFDTFGPVKSPFYTMQLSEKIDPATLVIGATVFFVPFNKDLSKYVFVEQLKKMKGSDASWRDNHEVPERYGFLEYFFLKNYVNKLSH